MVVSQLEYTERIAQAAVENKRLLEQSIRQRRNQVVDLQGIEFTRVGDRDTSAKFYVSISPDMVYMERFEFKLIIEDASVSDFHVSVDGVDVTAYLAAQYGRWISGDGVFPSLDIHENYDLLETASDMYAEGRNAQANAILRPGYKQIVISANGAFTVTMSQYIKYSHLNR